MPDVIVFDNIWHVLSQLIIRHSRTTAGLSKRALAKAANTAPAAIVLYEQGARDPGFDTLDRILLAAARGALRFDPTIRRVDRHRNAQRLVAVLDLAEHLPRRVAARTLRAPRLPQARSPHPPQSGGRS